MNENNKFRLQAACFVLALIFAISMMGLAVPAYAAQAEETLTELPTETVTEIPTETATEIPTETATETPVVTETPSPTVIPTETTPAPTVETPVIAATLDPSDRGGNSCYDNWERILSSHNKSVGYRYFDNPEHAWCQTWLLNTYGIDYETYKLFNP